MPSKQTLDLLDAAGLAERLQVSRRTALRLLAAGEFPNARQVGRGPRAPFVVPLADVIAYERRKSKPIAS